MTDKTIKVIGLCLLYSIVMAGAFRLLSPSHQTRTAPKNRLEAEKRSSPSQEFPPAPSPAPALPAVSVPSQIKSVSVGDGILNSTTNENDVLNQLRAWARTDPEAALAWGRQQTNNAERNEALTDACFQIAQTDPQRAVVLAEQFDLNKDAVLENLGQQWAGKDLSAACNWIGSQPEGDQRNALATGMTFVWSQTEPLGAAKFVVQQMTPGTAQDEAAIMVLHQWALLDPIGANAWAQQFPNTPLRDRALNELSGIERYKHDLAR
jgi:hypothetical protein